MLRSVAGYVSIAQHNVLWLAAKHVLNAQTNVLRVVSSFAELMPSRMFVVMIKWKQIVVT